MNNPMSISRFVEIAPLLPRDTSILIRGPHGIGKSQVVRQVSAAIGAKEGIKNFPVIDRRLSQMTEGDMIGLPSTDGNVTRFNPPDWYKAACDAPVTLFLDELNRATHEVMQAAFQVVLDRELNGWKLHPQTRVFAAVNASAEYTVNEMDPALLDRFWAIDLTPTTEDWLNWARGPGAIHPTITDFISSADKWLDPPKHTEAGSVHPSRRSWERLSKCLMATGVADNPEDSAFYSLSLGYIGVDASIAFYDFAKSVDNRVTGEDVVERYPKFKKKVEKLSQDRLNGLVEKVAEYVTKNLSTLSDKQGKNLQDFIKDIPGELRVSCWSKLTAHGLDKLELAKSVHKWCAAAILDVFGVPMGEKGIGVTPNIPEMLKNKK
jgi:alkaline phosphatase D